MAAPVLSRRAAPVYNVFRGDIVTCRAAAAGGPREVALYSLADRRRLSVKPGITCIWQISGRAEIDFRVRFASMSTTSRPKPGEDIKILARTPRAVVFGPGAIDEVLAHLPLEEARGPHLSASGPLARCPFSVHASWSIGSSS